MADSLPTSNFYRNLGGINLKASRYEMSTAQFLDLRNLDFDRPNALQKRPGSTFAVTTGTTGPIQSLFEFVKFSGESYIVAASDTALFYIASQQYTLLSSGWNNGQPPNMLTFVNKLWVANGQSWIYWSGQSGSPSSAAPVGLPASIFTTNTNALGATISYLHLGQQDNNTLAGGSYFTVGGASMVFRGAGPLSVRGVYLAYSYIRNDGYQGPADFISSARNIVRNSPGNGNEFFSSSSGSGVFWAQPGGYTIPPGLGISAIALWVGVDTISTGSTTANIPGVGIVPAGSLGWLDSQGTRSYASYSLKPDADLSRFWLYTIIPGASLFLLDDANSGITYYASTFILSSFSTYDGNPPLTRSFSGMPFNFFATYIPKYLEVNQNIMFMAGFSAAPSTVWFSEVGEPEVVNPENFFEVRTNDGDRIYALSSFNNALIILKEHSFSKLVGDSADNFQLIDLTSDYGCISNRTILSKDQLLYWLDRKGIVQFTGANWSIVSDVIDPIFRRMNLDAAKEKSVGVHHLYRNQFWWGIPVDGSTVNNLTIVYDYLVGAWTFFDGFNPASFAYIKAQLPRPSVWRGDYSGFVHFIGESFFSDSGQGITCLALTHFENEGGENQTTIWRRLFLDVATTSGGTGVINGEVFSNYNVTTVQATFSMFQNQFQTRAEMGVVGKAIASKFSHFSASLPLLLNGYGWGKRGLRNV